MRKWVVFIATVMLLVAAQAASAGERYHRDRYIVGGALLGLAIGAAVANNRDDRRGYNYDRGYGYGSDRPHNDRYAYSDGYRYERPVVRREVRVYRSAPRYQRNNRYCPPRRYGY